MQITFPGAILCAIATICWLAEAVGSLLAHGIDLARVTLAMGIVTWGVLDERLDAGRGYGHGDAYRPWLWVHRKNTPGQGNQVVDPLPGYRRASHFMAQVEWHVALLCVYLRALDVREQFPLWPFPHPHPLADHPETQQHRPRQCPGLIKIANKLGVDHGLEVGSDVPYVASLDLLVTLKRKKGMGLAGIALKPHELILSSESKVRVIERLQMEKVCMDHYAATHVVVDRGLIGDHTGGNMEFFSSGARVPSALQLESLQTDFKSVFIEAASETSISEGINRASRSTRLDPLSANLLWRHLTWRRQIEVDITAPLEMGQPLRCGGQAIARALAVELFGEEPR